ncbi:hypothetical protein PR202_gb17576 [Eleusine coracana subsp. coracana]|uniref:Growth-regulating factor n=1 Tax=Eleusine coracana subsp. coracana TaxID=191504 RepID=A0AAV5F4U1_ELECO|nr:hypothetical protein PR202_gb17576 [Eleusine coracana subsp. coracana]
MATGAPVPHDLVLPLRLATGLDTVPSLAFPPPNSLTVGVGYWGCYGGAAAGQYGSRKVVDPEPGRCRRTDGKKWRCSREAFGDSKYCEKHVHRGKNRSRKPVEPTTTSPSPYRPSPLSISPPAPAPADAARHHHHHHHQAPPLQLHLDAGSYRHAPSPPPSYHRYANNHAPASVFTGGGYGGYAAAAREVQEAEMRRQRCLALGADLSLDKPQAAAAAEKPVRQFFDEWTGGGGGVDDATQLSISIPTASPADLAAARYHNGKPAC